MAKKDDKKDVAPNAHEIPIDGGDAQDAQVDEAAQASGAPAGQDTGDATTQTAAAEAADTKDAQAEGAEASDATEDDGQTIVDEAEAVVDEAAAKAAEEAAGEQAQAEPSVEDQLAEAQAQAAAMRDKYLRLQAEWDNYRKRTAEQERDMRARATENVMKDLLPVLDDFERAVAHADANGEQGMLEGVKAIQSKLNEVLKKHGLVSIDPAGEPFDAVAHQAVGTVEDPSVPDETVAQVYQKGYKMGSKIIRSAMVTITSGGPRRPKEDTAESE
jgi:molecular chaperone GrpE